MKFVSFYQYDKEDFYIYRLLLNLHLDPQKSSPIANSQDWGKDQDVEEAAKNTISYIKWP